MSNLKILLFNGWLSSGERRIQQQYFGSNLPHLKVVLCNSSESSRYVMGIAVKEGKKQKSKVDLFRDLEPVYP